VPDPAGSGEAGLDAIAGDLAAGIEARLAGWVVRCVLTRCEDAGLAVDDTVLGTAWVAGVAARRDVAPRVRALLEQDIDRQRTNPLSVLRTAVRYPTAVLRSLGVPPVDRDAFAERARPEDPYDLAPASFADIDPSLAEPGIRWGAAKAHVHLTRRRAEGRR
jgi:hypothetical protein